MLQMRVQAIKKLMENESPRRKMVSQAVRGFFFVATATFGAIYLAWMANVDRIQTAYNLLCETNAGCYDVILYDTVWLIGGSSDPEKAN